MPTNANTSSLERSIGRIEGQLEGIVATLKRVDDRSAARDGTLESVLDRLGAMEDHAETMKAVATEFNTLRQTIRDGKMQARGVLLGVGLAGGVGGATVATFLKGVWTQVFGG
jgi:hypothetical protein